jgi:hypothetical protein
LTLIERHGAKYQATGKITRVNNGSRSAPGSGCGAKRIRCEIPIHTSRVNMHDNVTSRAFNRAALPLYLIAKVVLKIASLVQLGIPVEIFAASAKPSSSFLYACLRLLRCPPHASTSREPKAPELPNDPYFPTCVPLSNTRGSPGMNPSAMTPRRTARCLQPCP